MELPEEICQLYYYIKFLKFSINYLALGARLGARLERQGGRRGPRGTLVPLGSRRASGNIWGRFVERL